MTKIDFGKVFLKRLFSENKLHWTIGVLCGVVAVASDNHTLAILNAFISGCNFSFAYLTTVIRFYTEMVDMLAITLGEACTMLEQVTAESKVKNEKAN